MDQMSSFIEQFIRDLIEIGSMKFGDFILGNNDPTTAYFDMRLIPSYPLIMKRVVDLICAKLIEQNLQFDIICGVPFAAISFASCVSIEQNKGMILKRHSIKKYGTQKLIEGHWKRGMRCLIIEDVVVRGNSIKEVVEDLRNNGIIVEDAVTILDREQGGVDNLWTSCGVKLHSILTCHSIHNFIRKEYTDISAKLMDFINLNCTATSLQFDRVDEDLTNGVKANSIGAKLRAIAERKASNIILALDFDNSREILKMIEVCAPHVCAVKLHADMIMDFDDAFVSAVVELSASRDFMLIEDRKLCDVNQVVARQYTSGNTRMASWAHLVTVHAILGEDTISALKNAANDVGDDRGCLLISEMSSASSFKSAAYRAFVLKLAERHSDFVAGFICQERLTAKDGLFVNITPGVRLETNCDSLDQVYKNPVKSKNMSDFYVVGRGITEASDPLEAVVRYKDQLYRVL